jgi:hypothetical protein
MKMGLSILDDLPSDIGDLLRKMRYNSARCLNISQLPLALYYSTFKGSIYTFQAWPFKMCGILTLRD